MFNLGMPELVVIFGILVLLFGGKRIASLGKDIGSGIKNFKDAFKEIGPKDEE